MRLSVLWLVLGGATLLDCNAHAQWQRHIIDQGSRGADGVRLTDINQDGWPDCVVGWEQGNVVRVSLHPGREAVRHTWPTVTVGAAGDVEDAVFADLDGDGIFDVVSCSEGKTRTISIHWAPAGRAHILEQTAWKTEILPAASKRMMWMFATPTQLDGLQGIDIVAGGKGADAFIGWFEAPGRPRDLSAWKWHPLRPVGWLMSLEACDMDDDGDRDILFSDRKLERSGIYWLENPGLGKLMQPWPEHPVGALQAEAMFLNRCDVDQDGLEDIVAAIRPGSLLWLRRSDPSGRAWSARTIPLPEEAGSAKAVHVGDIDSDGRYDLVFSCENAKQPKQGVMWLSAVGTWDAGNWAAHPISGATGVKFDLLQLVDLDADGDLDVMTTEEVSNLGVIWYENPQR